MEKIGLQLYSLQEIAQENMERALRLTAEMGYDMVEFAGFFGHTAKEISELLQKYGLLLYGTHTGVHELQEDTLEETIGFHKYIGNKIITIPAYPICEEGGKERLIALVNRIAPILAENGIELHYHNHSAEFLKGGYPLYDELAEKTPLLFQLDINHIFSSGFDPLEVLRRYQGKVACLHLRDGDGLEQPPRTLGEGKVPVAQCYRYAVENGLPIVVENCCKQPDAVTSTKQSIDYLRNIFL